VALVGATQNGVISMIINPRRLSMTSTFRPG
jgi:hypothetical protein